MAKSKLQEWIKEYDGGVKNHGEPNTWDVTLVTDMSYLFHENKTFNAPIDKWDVSNVTNMAGMFAHATSFNQEIGMWKIAQANIDHMFEGAKAHALCTSEEFG